MMRGMAGQSRPGRVWRMAVLAAGLVGVAGLLAWTVLTWMTKGLEAAAWVAGIAAAVLAVPAVLAWLVGWWRTSTAPRPAPSGEELEQAAAKLAEAVAEQWREEAEARSLNDPAPMPVRWRATGRAELVDHSVNRTPGVLEEACSDDIPALVERFRALRRRRLVILGAPGSGKTTLAVQLLRSLLESRREGEAVPVLLSAADWDVDRHPRLADWVAAVLDRDYPLLRTPGMPPGAADRLAERGRILPMLDGLDEMPVPARASVLTALNRSLDEGDPVVVTCRTDEYAHTVATAGDVLTSAEVLEAEPLTPRAAADYLHRCLPPQRLPAWEPVLARLRAASPHWPGAGRVLAEVAATPLGLWLVRTVYIDRNADPAPLLDEHRFPTADTLRDHLFDHLIDVLITTRPPITDSGKQDKLFRPRRRHDSVRVRAWLGYLAALLDGQGTRDLAWWRLAATIPTFPATFRLTVGLTAGFIGWLAFGLTYGLASGLLFGLTFGLLGWLRARQIAESAIRDLPGYADLRLRHRWTDLIHKLASRFTFGLSAGLSAGLAVGIASGPMHGLGAKLIGGLIAGFTFGLMTMLMGGLMEWAEAPASAARATTPTASWKADRNLNLLRIGTSMLAIGLSLGLNVGFLYGFSAGLTSGLTGGISGGLALGLAGGLTVGNHRAWLAYLVATCWLAWKKLLPRNMVAFLDDCHQIGLLRAIGPLYQFRHAEFQDYLVSNYQRTYETGGGRGPQREQVASNTGER